MREREKIVKYRGGGERGRREIQKGGETEIKT